MLARALIGMVLVRDAPDGLTAARIVETEAYPPGDPASHAFRRQTPRNRVMFSEKGRAYVYLGYGVSWLVNVSSEAEGVGAAALIRAAEPVAGLELMRARRGRERATELMSGPGKLCAAMAIDRSLDGVDLCASGPLWLSAACGRPPVLDVSIRIGITRAAEAPLRFIERGSRFLSGPARLNRPA